MADNTLHSVKRDPEAPSPSTSTLGLGDDDIYENTQDELEINTDEKMQTLYFGRIPEALWAAWAELDDDAEIKLGVVRKQLGTNPNGKTLVESTSIFL